LSVVRSVQALPQQAAEWPAGTVQTEPQALQLVVLVVVSVHEPPQHACPPHEYPQ
jgi:hypothetical protein